MMKKLISMKGKFSVLVWMIIFINLTLTGQEGLIGYWSFDELEAEEFHDHSENGNHGINNGAEIIPGIKGNALYFDGKGDFATIAGKEGRPPEVLEDLGYGSISIWFKVDHIPPENGIAPIFYYGSQSRCDFFDAANKGLIIEAGHSPVHYKSERLYFTIWSNGCTLPSFCYDSNDHLKKGQWYHFVAVVGEDYNTGYLNGKEMLNRRYNFGNSSSSQFFEDAVVHERLWLGRGYWDRSPQFFEGGIDELRIYNRPLSGEEVEKLYGDALDSFTSTGQESTVGQVFNIYPNPAKDNINYDLRNIKADIHGFRISDLTGKTIISKTLVSKRGNLDVKNWPAGIYNIEFYGEGINYNRKILLQE